MVGERVVVGCEKKIGVKMKDDEELEMLLGEIPHATSLNHHHHYPHTTNGHHGHGNGNGNGNGYGGGGGGGVGVSFLAQNMNGMMYGMYDDDPSCSYKHNTCVSPVSGFSLHSDGSSSSLFSANGGGHSLSENGSPTPPQLEDLRSHFLSRTPHYPNGLPPSDTKLGDLSYGKRVDHENMIDQLRLSRSLSKMYISDEQEDELGQYCDGGHCSGGGGSDPINFTKFVEGADNCSSKAISDYTVVQNSVSRSPMGLNGELGSALFGFQQGCGIGNLMGMQYVHGQADGLFSQSIGSNTLAGSQCHGTKGQDGYYYQGGFLVPNLDTSASRSSVANALLCARQIGMMEERGSSNFPSMSHLTFSRSNNMGNGNQFPSTLNTRVRASSNVRVPQGDLETFSSEDGLIIQEDGLNYVTNRGFAGLRGQCKKGSLHEIGGVKPQQKRSQLDSRSQFAGACENGRSARMHCPLSLPTKWNTLADAQGYIFLIAKDQHGCRFLQKIFDEGTSQDVQIIFNEIIGHVVELMINPFGNYLMQKLLEVCNEEQRMRILLVVTEEPGELVRISLNTHGTRVVQKLIETLKTRQQISLVISALEPGFLNLIKDLNGNHVVQRCLQCLSNEDNKFIFVAAAKYCVDIATHQHGCCVLQRCISHSTGEHRESLVAEISANGLLLAQDAFGNYVVQFILELKIPSAMSKLTSQFEGNYVHLSTQKFSSHVVEKCLLVLNNEARSMIIHELLSANHFEQLLQDPHANYVVQTALRVAEGPLHNSLVNAIESHKAMSRNSPYSKRIFSHKLLKK